MKYFMVKENRAVNIDQIVDIDLNYQDGKVLITTTAFANDCYFILEDERAERFRKWWWENADVIQ